MRTVLVSVLLLVLAYGCAEVSGKKPADPLPENQPAAPEHLRIGRAKATQMRSRRQADDASVKMSVSDVLSLIGGAAGPNDSLLFYFVRYDRHASDERDRYLSKVPGANWNDVAKKPSSLLVGFVPGGQRAGWLLSAPRQLTQISVYDLGVVCPPPPDCACEIRE